MKAIVTLAVCAVLSLAACKTATVSERGMQGGASFGSPTSDFSYPSRSKTAPLTGDFNRFTESKDTAESINPPSEKNVKTEIKGIKQLKNLAKIEQENHSALPLSMLPGQYKLVKYKNHMTGLPSKDHPNEGSIRWFIYFLLCFLIPPLAYYLIKQTSDTLFWVCLICYLMTLSFFGGFRYGILGLLSIVIALLALFQIEI